MTDDLSDLTPMQPTPENIWKYRQNCPTLIAMDFGVSTAMDFGVSASVTYTVLLAQGKGKWFVISEQHHD